MVVTEYPHFWVFTESDNEIEYKIKSDSDYFLFKSRLIEPLPSEILLTPTVHNSSQTSTKQDSILLHEFQELDVIGMSLQLVHNLVTIGVIESNMMLIAHCH